MLGKRVRSAPLERTKSLTMLVAACAYLVFAAPASAEWFVDLYLGGAFTEKHDVDTESTTFGTRVTTLDVTFDPSVVAGLRGGYWFPFRLGPINLGAGLDISHFAPDISRQTRTFCSRFCVSGDFDDLDISVWTIGFDAMVRWPLLKTQSVPDGRLQPYFTIGPAIFVAHADDSGNFVPATQSSTDSSVGVKLGVGAAWLFTRHIAVFGEYRYTHFSPDFSFSDSALGTARVSTDINTHYLIVGTSFRF